MSDKAVVQGVLACMRTFKSTKTIALTIEFPEEYKELWMMESGCPVAVARLMNGENTEAAVYGDEAKTLRQSPFFRTPAVWVAISPKGDGAYLKWLRGQRCVKRGSTCAGDVVAAHVSLTYQEEGGEMGAHGKGIKAVWSAVPLCDTHHRIQHGAGYEALGSVGFWRRQRVEHIEKWAWETLKEKLGYESWKNVPPGELSQWATENEVYDYLPATYQSI